MRIDLNHPDSFYLSSVQNGDQAAYVEHFRDKDTTDCLLKIPYPYTEDDAEKWVRVCLEATLKQPHETNFALRRSDGFLIGGAGLVLNGGAAEHRAELGYWVSKDYRGRGLATAITRVMVRHAFQSLGLQRIEALTFSQNLISQRVLEKAGFKLEGLLQGYHIKNGILQDACMYGLLKTDTSES